MLSFAAVYAYKKMHKLDIKFQNKITELENEIYELRGVCLHLNNEEYWLYTHYYMIIDQMEKGQLNNTES